MRQIRVRFAPSPTGYLHIGGARTALFNWFFARRNQGAFVLRIEDTDTGRLKEDSVSQILSSMKWLGMNWDEGPEVGGENGPYYQSQRLELYRREAERLVAEGKAYYCFCSPEELNAVHDEQRRLGQAFRYNGKCRQLDVETAKQRLAAGESAVIRLKIPEQGKVTVRDLIRGEVTFSLDQLDDLIIMKSNGMPAYNFACVVDDYAMAISQVIRAEEHLSNTPKQVLLYQALGYEVPEFAHLSMILAPDRSKLSKRHGATSVEEFREQGFLAPAIVNYLTFLGWSAEDDQEILTPEETIRQFDLEKVSKKAAIYDTKKLTWINGRYMASLPVETIAHEAIPFFIRHGLITEKQAVENYGDIERIVAAVRDRVKTLVELTTAVEYYFWDVTEYEEKGWKKHCLKPEALSWLQAGRDALAALTVFDIEHTEQAYEAVLTQLGIKAGALIHPTRLALTGRTVSPGIYDVMVLLGQDRCLARLDQAIQRMKRETSEE